MSVQSCKWATIDIEGLRHTVNVTAQTLYEAVALGMAANQKYETQTFENRADTGR